MNGSVVAELFTGRVWSRESIGLVIRRRRQLGDSIICGLFISFARFPKASKQWCLQQSLIGMNGIMDSTDFDQVALAAFVQIRQFHC